MKIGCILSGPTPRLPALAKYAGLAPLPIPPPDVVWTHGIESWPMLANDVLGDCTVAGVLHYAQAAERWKDGTARQPVEADARAAYMAMGWDGVGEGGGAVLSEVMRRWQSPGFDYHGGTDSIDAFARIRLEHLKFALWTFGPVVVGVELPISAQSAAPWQAPASLTGDDAPGSWGGHCMLVVAVYDDGSVDFVTWGGVRRASAEWVQAYFAEGWAVLHPTWVRSGVSPSGFVVDALRDDMARVA